jgi:hypothetical protein
MVFSKYKEEDMQLTGVPTFLTKLSVVAPLNKVATNVRKLSSEVAYILLSTERKLRISIPIFVRIVCYEISLISFQRDAAGFRQTEGRTERQTHMTQLILAFNIFLQRAEHLMFPVSLLFCAR